VSGSKDNIGDSRIEKPRVVEDLVERFDTRRRLRNKTATAQLLQAEVVISHSWDAAR